MKKFAKTTVAAIVVAVSLTAIGAQADWGSKRGKCESGDYRGGPAMMHHKGKGRFADRELDLTTEEARTLVQARLIMRGNDRLKVGQVVEQDEDTYLVDIVTVDNSLVRQIEIDRDNGFPRGPMGAKR